MKVTDALQQIRTDNKVEVKKSRKAEEAGGPGTAPTDKVELSSGSRDVQKMQEILAETPPIRTELVESLKQQIEKGEYQVDSRDIADKMMETLLSESPRSGD